MKKKEFPKDPCVTTPYRCENCVRFFECRPDVSSMPTVSLAKNCNDFEMRNNLGERNGI
jgi:hypothetical protein